MAVLSTSSIMVVSEWNWDYCGAPMALAAFLGFTSPALSVGSKNFIKKITKHEKTISIAETKKLSVSGLFSKAIENNNI